MWDDIHQNNQTFNSLKAYGQSKSANILHALELSKRLEGKENESVTSVFFGAASSSCD